MWTGDADLDPVFYRILIRILVTKADRKRPDPDPQHGVNFSAPDPEITTSLIPIVKSALPKLLAMFLD